MLETEAAHSTNLSTIPEDFDPYVCKLSQHFKTLAKEELHEDDNIRKQALSQFREWISKHPHIKKCRTDAEFLLRFLRSRKFNVSSACQVLERYLTARQLYPQWFKNLDIEDPALKEIFESGYLFPLPQRDEQGRRVLFSCAAKFNPYKFTSAHMVKIHTLIFETLIDEEETQVSGCVYIIDQSDMNMGLISLWSLVDLKRFITCFQNSSPMRRKEMHFINIPSFARKIIDFGVSCFSDKLKKRTLIHKSIDDLNSKINPEILPKEYGGKVSISEMIAEFKETLLQKRAAILALDDMEIEVVKENTSSTDQNESDFDSGVVGSFRKLEVD